MSSLIKKPLLYIRFKTYDVFAASRAFQSGVSLEQLLVCHWKSHIFTQFYLKDVALTDLELFHLGPVVAAWQIHR